MNAAKIAVGMIRKATFICVFAGAGMSAESGIPTFQSTNWSEKSKEKGFRWEEDDLVRYDVSNCYFFKESGRYENGTKKKDVPLKKKKHCFTKYWEYREQALQGVTDVIRKSRYITLFH